MNEKMPEFQWIDKLKTNGWGNKLRFVLDVLEPVAPLASQMLWVLQPMSSIFDGQNAVRELAEALDTPEGIKALKKKLDE